MGVTPLSISDVYSVKQYHHTNINIIVTVLIVLKFVDNVK